MTATIPRKIKRLAASLWRARQQKNAAARDDRQATKDLVKAMLDERVRDFQTKVDGVELEVSYAPGEREEVDAAALFKLVTREKFFAIVSASQEAVKKHAGPEVLAKVVQRVHTDARLQLKKA